jgi:hypothetical protein
MLGSFQIELESLLAPGLDADASVPVEVSAASAPTRCLRRESQNEGAGDARERAEHDGRWLSTLFSKSTQRSPSSYRARTALR